MLPFDIPNDTTPETLFSDILPAAHRKLVPDHTAGRAYTLGVTLRGGRRTDLTYVVDGARIDVCAEERPAEIWMSVHRDAVETFLDDWWGNRSLFPTVAPSATVQMLTDPRLLRRLLLVDGRVEVTLRGHASGNLALVIGSHGGKAKPIDPYDVETRVALSMPTYSAFLAGALPPEDALQQTDLSGRKLVAMQFALALASALPQR